MQKGVAELVKKIVFGLQKGGVGKTTSALSTAAALSQKGKRVLLLDGDPQGNSTTGCQVDPAKITLTLYDLLMKKNVQLGDVITKTEYGFDLIPAHIELAKAELELVSAFRREEVLTNKLKDSSDELANYDYLLIDNPPSLGLLTVNELVAADQVIMPVQCDLYAIMGLQAFMDVVGLAQTVNTNLRLLGVLLTMYDRETKVSSEVEQNVREILGDVVFKTRIGAYSELKKIPKNGPLQFWRPKHPASLQYNDFVEELISRVE